MNSKGRSISVLFVTYNRLITLRPTLETFLANTDFPRDQLELIVADDASPPDVQAQIRGMPFDVFCLSSTRGGMGANTNRGLAAATGDFILQIQDDWECRGPADYLSTALAAMEAAADCGLILLRPSPNAHQLHRIMELRSGTMRLYANRPDAPPATVADHAYSDWPHLKRRGFVDSVGFYCEGRPMWDTELEYSRRVNAQARWHVADMPQIDAFRHIGESYSYNWPWKKRIEHLVKKLPYGALAMKFYRTALKRPLAKIFLPRR